MTGLLCFQEHKYLTNPVHQKLLIAFFAFAFICPLPGYILCMLPYFNKCKYSEKDRGQNEGEMKDFVGSWKLQILISVLSGYPRVFIGRIAPLLSVAAPGCQPICAGSRVPACSLRALRASHIILQSPYQERKNESLRHDLAPLC